MDKCLEKCNPPKLNQEEAESPNRLILTSEIEAVIKNSWHTKALGWTDSQENFIKHIQGRANSYPSQTIPKNPRRGKASKLFLRGQYYTNSKTK